MSFSRCSENPGDLPPLEFHCFREFSLCISVDKVVDKIRLVVGGEEYLHLSDVLIDESGILVSLRDVHGIDVAMSSVVRGDDNYSISHWVKGESNFFSTKKENNPWVEVFFHESLYIQNVALINRKDGLWERADKIEIYVQSSGVEHLIFSNSSAIDRARVVADNLRKIDVSSDILRYQSCSDLGRGFLEDANDLFDLIVRDPDQLKIRKERVKELVAFGLSLFGRKKEVSIFVILGVAYYLDESRNVDAFRFFKAYREWVVERDLNVLDDFLSVFGEVRHGYPLVIGSHKFCRPIRSWGKDVLLKTLREISKVVESSVGYKCIVAYGTLLGLYRDGDFITHDDDMDMLLLVEEEVALSIVDDVALSLRSSGYRVVKLATRGGGYPFLQVTSKAHKVPLDIFVGALDDNNVSLPMEKVKYRSIKKDLIFPPVVHDFENVELYFPADIEGFLSERYGDWEIPDKFFRAKENKF